RANFTLVDVRFDVPVQEFDRIFDRDDVRRTLLVEMLDQCRERRRLSRAGYARHQHQSTRRERDLLTHIGEIELLDRLCLERDDAERKRDGPTLLIRIDTETAYTGDAECVVALLDLGVFLEVTRRHRLLGYVPQIFYAERLAFESNEVAIDAQRRRPSNLE